MSIDCINTVKYSFNVFYYTDKQIMNTSLTINGGEVGLRSQLEVWKKLSYIAYNTWGVLLCIFGIKTKVYLHFLSLENSSAVL